MDKRAVLYKGFATLGVFLIAAPVFLLIGAALSPARLLLWLLPPAAALLLACLVRALPQRLRVAGAVAALLLSASSAIGLGLWLRAGLGFLFPALLCCALLIVHLLALTQQSGEEYHQAVWYAGVMVYLLTRMCTANQTLRPARPALMTCCLLYFVYMVFALNAQTLHDGMGGGRAPSRLMRLRNGCMALLLSLLLLALTHVSQLQKALAAVLAALKRAVLWLLSLLASQAEPIRDAGERGSLDLGALADGREPSAFLLFLEKVMRVAALVAAAAAALFVLYLLLRTLVRAVRALIRRLRDYAGVVTDAYEDTVESLLDWGEVRAALRERHERAHNVREQRIPWEKLTPRQRVRRSYQQYLRRHPEIPDQCTARQTLTTQEPLAALYEAARYSREEIDPLAAEQTRILQKQ